MKALNKMNTVEKAKLLSDLFPDEVLNMICFIEKQTAYFLQNEYHIKSNWKASLITADDWFIIVRNAEKSLMSRYRQLYVTQKWFSNQLFDGYKALFTIYCMVEYADAKECDVKLKQGVHLIFGEDRLMLTKPKDNNKI